MQYPKTATWSIQENGIEGCGKRSLAQKFGIDIQRISSDNRDFALNVTCGLCPLKSLVELACTMRVELHCDEM
jgi:hypothetical protein